jgi:hypothetical protein
MDRKKLGKIADPEASKLLSKLIANDPFASVDKENQDVGFNHQDSRSIVEGVDPLRLLHAYGDRWRVYLEFYCDYVRRCTSSVRSLEFLCQYLRSEALPKR